MRGKTAGAVCVLGASGALLFASLGGAQTVTEHPIVGHYTVEHNDPNAARVQVRERMSGDGFEGFLSRSGPTATAPGCEYSQDDFGKVVLLVGPHERFTPSSAAIYRGTAMVIVFESSTQSCSRSQQNVRVWASGTLMRICFTKPEGDEAPELDDGGGTVTDGAQCMDFKKDDPKPASIVLPTKKDPCNNPKLVKVSFKRPPGVILNKVYVRVTGKKTIVRGSKQLAKEPFVEFTLPKIRTVKIAVELYATSGLHKKSKSYRICGVK